MSKNIIMQQKTADGYEELYPKANGDGSVIVNNTTNQFLGGGSTVGDALEYLSKFGMYWWKKVYQKPNYGVKSNSGTVGKYLLNRNIYYKSPTSRSTQTTFLSEKIFFYLSQPSADDQGNLVGQDPLSATLRIYGYSTEAYGGTRTKITFEMKSDDGSKNIWERKNSSGDNLWLYVEGAFIKITSNTFIVKTDFRENYADSLPATWATTLTVIRPEYVPYISSYTTTTTYICSSDPNAYPDQGNTDSSGAKYWKVGQPWEFLPKLGKVETGYYTGTGSGNVTLTFENAPQFVFISYKISTGGGHASCAWCKDLSQGPYWVTGSSTQANDVTQSGNSLTFTSMNKNAVAYQYFAITQ